MEGEGMDQEAIFEKPENGGGLPRMDPFEDDPESVANMIKHKHQDDPDFEIDNLEIV